MAEITGRVGMRSMAAPSSNSIITSGLIMNLDAGNPSSYTGTGTTWTDLSGNGNNGTLVNGVGYSSANGGTMVLDGVNDYVSTNVQSLNNNPYSLSMTFKISSFNGSDMRLFGAYSGSTDQLAAGFNGTQLWLWNGGFYNPSFNASANTVYTIDIVHSASANLIYVNGAYNSTVSFSSYFNNLGFGNPYVNSYGAYFRGSIFSAKLYNRALSASEVLQNHNASKVF